MGAVPLHPEEMDNSSAPRPADGGMAAAANQRARRCTASSNHTPAPADCPRCRAGCHRAARCLRFLVLFPRCECAARRPPRSDRALSVLGVAGVAGARSGGEHCDDARMGMGIGRPRCHHPSRDLTAGRRLPCATCGPRGHINMAEWRSPGGKHSHCSVRPGACILRPASCVSRPRTSEPPNNHRRRLVPASRARTGLRLQQILSIACP